jgi:hypothetical protein
MVEGACKCLITLPSPLKNWCKLLASKPTDISNAPAQRHPASFHLLQLPSFQALVAV